MNVPRQHFDLLKATLTNCIRKGPESQNRDGLVNFKDHLAGRVAFIASVNPANGEKLRDLFLRIQ